MHRWPWVPHMVCDMLTLLSLNWYVLASTCCFADRIDLSHLNVRRFDRLANHFVVIQVEAFTRHLVGCNMELLHDVRLANCGYCGSFALKWRLWPVAAEENRVHALHVELLQLGPIEVVRDRFCCLVGVFFITVSAVYAHEPSERVHRAHWPYHWFSIRSVLLVSILVVFHHLVPIWLPQVTWSNDSNLFGYHIVEFLVLYFITGRNHVVDLGSVLLINCLVRRAQSLDSSLETWLVLRYHSTQ